jgi:hypothetical protein
MIHNCNKCHEPKKLNSLNYKTTKVKGKLYFEKTCKTCRQTAATKRAAERYENDSLFREKKLAINQRLYLVNRASKTPVYQHKLEATKKWKDTHKEHIRKRDKDRHRKRWSNPTYRVSKNMSNYVNKHIRDKDFSHVFDLLGYSISDLMAHLEKQFSDGMSWSNYGAWHIDHRKPVCSFEFESKNDKQFLECWKLDNLRPLWAKDNLIKSSFDKLVKASQGQSPSVGEQTV